VRADFVKAVEKSVYERMSSIDLLKWGLLYNRNVKRGWLMDLLLAEKIIDASKDAKNDRLWKDYLAQQIFIDGMQAALGDEFDPRASKQGRKANGDFDTNKNGVPQNYLTVKYLLHAYDYSYSSFKRFKASHNYVEAEKKPHKNKGKSIFEDKEFASGFYSPYRMYLKQKWAQWMETDAGRNADPVMKKVSDVNVSIS
jgi:hypothetical protein